ncbi:hypothetical protein B0H14DRAFT_2659274 [Mycena olivaceomarginata]|nr:hypothetical protein B0H14DRAFT_2659274 [Mycena olivaceomarginata]
MSTIPFIILLMVAATLPMVSIYALSGFMLMSLLHFCEDQCRLMHLGIRKLDCSNVWCECYPLLEDQKIAHYLHLPPRVVIGMQILAAFVGLPVNFGCELKWGRRCDALDFVQQI